MGAHLRPSQDGNHWSSDRNLGIRLVGAAYYLWKVMSQIPLRLEIPGWRDVKPFLTTSSMLTIRNMSIMFNFVAMTMFAGAYGAVATACHQVAISVFMIGNLSAEPFSQCAQSFLASIGS